MGRIPTIPESRGVGTWVGKFTPVARARKAETMPPKPNKEFPLCPHPAGAWAKKLHGKSHTLGVGAASEAARWSDWTATAGRPYCKSTRLRSITFKRAARSSAWRD
jgi:hypothetical protein